MTPLDPTSTGKSPTTIGVTAARQIAAMQRLALPARYGYPLAILGTGFCLGLSILLQGFLGRTIYLVFWPLIFALAAFAGIGPSVLASLLTVLAVDYFLVPPVHAIGLTDPADIFSAALFVLASVVVSTLAAKRRRAEEEAAAVARSNAELAQQLEEQAIELESQLEESQTMSLELEQTGAELEEEREAAEKAAAFTRGIIEAITDPFIVQDANWRFTFVNPPAAAQFFRTGHSSADGRSLIGRVVWDVYPDIVGTQFEHGMRQAAELRQPTTFEAFYPESGRWQSLTCFPLHDGGLAIQWKDVTARRRAEEQQRYLEKAATLLVAPLDIDERIRRLVALMVPGFADWCGIHLLDDAGHPTLAAVSHADPDKIRLAQDFERKYPPRDEDAYGIAKVLRTGEAELTSVITDAMLVATARDDEHLRMSRELGLRSSILVPLAVRDKVLGVLTLISAETGRQYTREDLALATELARRAAYSIDNARQHQAALDAQHLAEAANRAKGQFLAAMSHELRTPLNAIAGYIDLILLGIRGPISEEQRIDLERVRNAQQHLLGLITDVLDFSRVEAGRVKVKMTRVAVEPVLSDVVSLLEPQMRERRLRLEYIRAKADLYAAGDEDRIRQIALNLLSNALKYTEAGGSIHIASETRNGRVRIHVIDSGIGIDAAEIERIFQPFVQVHRTLSSPTDGVGLGLAISRELARAMHGELLVTSAPGAGSRFTLELPEADT